MSKIIPSGGFLSNLGKKTLLIFGVPLAKDILPQLAFKTTSSVIHNA